MKIQILMTTGVIIFLILIYKRYRVDEEELFGLKLIGYYLLGGFRFNLNNLTIPIGFIVFILFFKPKTNKLAKRFSACLGLTMFFIGIFSTTFSEYYFERTRYIEAPSTNIYDLGFEKDYLEIKQKLKVDKVLLMEDFIADFEKNGEILQLEYKLIEKNSEGIVTYNVELVPQKKLYKIKPVKIKKWVRIPSFIEAQDYFEAIEEIDIRLTIPKEDYPLYSIVCLGESGNYALPNYEHYLIENGSINKLDENQLPIEGHIVWIYGVIQRNGNNDCISNRRVFIIK